MVKTLFCATTSMANISVEFLRNSSMISAKMEYMYVPAGMQQV